MSDWNTLPNEIPKFGEMVLIVDMNSPDPIIDFGSYFGDDDWTSYGANVVTPTHWIHLPELPIWDVK